MGTKPLHRWTIGCLALVGVESLALAQYGFAPANRYPYPGPVQQTSLYRPAYYPASPQYRAPAYPYTHRVGYSTPYSATLYAGPAYSSGYRGPYTAPAYRPVAPTSAGYPTSMQNQARTSYASRASYPSYYTHRTAYGTPTTMASAPSYSVPGYGVPATPTTHTSRYGYNGYAYGYPPAYPYIPPVPAVAPRACPAPPLPPVEEPKEPVKFHRECNEKYWVSGGYMAAWIKDGQLPGPLLTIGSVVNQFQGALGEAGTAVIFGDRLSYETSMGLQAEVGMFLDCDNRFSVEARGFYLFDNTINFTVASDSTGNPLIARPVFNTDEDREGSFVVSFPGLIVGATTIEANSQLFGGEVNGRCHAYWHKRLHTDVLAGFRYLNLREDLLIRDELSGLVPNVLTFNGLPLDLPATIIESDRFACENQFWGLQVGGRARIEWDWCSLGVWAKAALGATDQNVRIEGSTTAISPAGTQSAPGGILALPTNIGDRSQTVFSVVPEVGINFNVDLHKNIRLTSGYSFMAWTGVARPGSHVSRRGSPGLAPSDQAFGTTGVSAEPTFTFVDETFWIHALTLGIEFHY